MRLWFPTLLFLAIFAGATFWQSRWTDGLRQRRDAAWDAADRSRSEAGERALPAPRPQSSDLARVTVGRPSGAAPLPLPEPQPPRGRMLTPPEPGVWEVEPQGAAPGDLAETPATATGYGPPDFTMVVRTGQTLSVICEQHYGTAREPLVRALAAYNGLSSPDSIITGQTLVLPALERLTERGL